MFAIGRVSASGGGKEKEEWGRSKDTRATRVISVWRLDSIAMRRKIKEETTKLPNNIRALESYLY